MASVASAQRMVDAELGTTAHPAPTKPIRVQLASAAGTASAPGTAIANPAPADVAFAAANTSGVAASSTSQTMTNSSGGSVTVTGINLIDSTATPRFLGYGDLAGADKTVANGDTLSFAAGQITYAVTPAA